MSWFSACMAAFSFSILKLSDDFRRLAVVTSKVQLSLVFLEAAWFSLVCVCRCEFLSKGKLPIFANLGLTERLAVGFRAAAFAEVRRSATADIDVRFWVSIRSKRFTSMVKFFYLVSDDVVQAVAHVIVLGLHRLLIFLGPDAQAKRLFFFLILFGCFRRRKQIGLRISEGRIRVDQLGVWNALGSGSF